MTTYVYETLSVKAGEKPRYYEIKQNMSDSPLTQHPETREPIRRVVLGGFGVLSSAKSSQPSSASAAPCCGPNCGCH